MILFIAQLGVAQEKLVIEYNFRVEGVCGMCQDRIEKVALEKGAEEAFWDISTKNLTVSVDESKVSPSDIRWALAQAGHDNGSFIAPEEIYNNLHGCCKYRDEEVVKAHEVVPEDYDISNDEQIDLSIIEGNVYGLDDDGKKFPLIGANISIDNKGKGAVTNFEGFFKLDNPDKHEDITISYIGFNDKTVKLTSNGILDITLSSGHQLDEVVINYRRKTTEVSFVKTLNVENITRQELTKAACCNLSESFETNPTVDVSFTDAITGTRQIKMLGLAGPYVQITRELMPDVRAMSSIYGLSLTPGPWVQSIQLIKGAGSVVNGFESLTGQINVELKKPEAGERLHVNGYFNEGSRMELNVNTRKSFSEKLSTGFLIHGKRMGHGNDRNNDGFLDMLLEKDLIAINRWKWNGNKGWTGQFGIKGAYLDHSGGSHAHFEGSSTDHQNHWKMYMTLKRLDFWLKTGNVFPNNPTRSVGFQFNAIYHDQNSEFGFNKYDNLQKSVYANLIFQQIFEDPFHALKAGMSFQYDDIEEFVAKSGAGFFERRESVSGAFVEYSYNDERKLAIVPGIRIDHHNNYGLFVTPRINIKYNLAEKSVIRLNAGRGQRTASIFSENLGLFSTNRQIVIDQTPTENPYGLDAEVAWNYGINWTQSFPVSEKEIILSMDVYRTQFENQIVVDYENPREVSFYNLDGKSYSNSFQIKLDYELIPNFDIRLAYRLFDVKSSYQSELKTKPLVSKHRAFINMAYTTKKDWSFDLTFNWKGQQRITDTSSNPEIYRRPDMSPDYILANAQISKKWGEKFEIYLGGENLFDYQQQDAIIASEDPFGQYFDGSMVYAPLFGKNIYIGFRYNLEN